MSQCVLCGTTSEQTGEELFEIQGKHYCIPCLWKSKSCDGCNTIKYFGDSEGQVKYYTGVGKYLCTTCAASLQTCSRCGRESVCDTLNGSLLCVDCISENYFKCDVCHTYHLNSERTVELTRKQYPSAGLTENTCISCAAGACASLTPIEVYFCNRCRKYHNQIYIQGSTFCKDCHERGKVYLCAHCNTWHTPDDIVESRSGKYICGNCTSKCFFCGCCGEYIIKASQKNPHNNICDKCQSEYTQCFNCKGYAPKNERTKLTHIDGYLCRNCLEHFSGKCRHCKEHSNYILDGYCPECRGKLGIGPIRSYSYKPNPTFRGKGPLFYGFENEISFGDGYGHSDFDADDVDYCCDEDDSTSRSGYYYRHFKEDHIYLKSDSSIDNGFELVSCPMSFEYFKSQDWSKLIHPDQTQSDSCGLHVHMSRAGFTSLHLFKFIKFFHQNDQLVQDIARRNYCNYSKKVKDRFIDDVKAKRGSERYQSINLTNEHTIEVRLFAGVMKIEQLHVAMEFLDALYYFSRDTSLKVAHDSSLFKKYVAQNQVRYNSLFNFISK